jgi:hypothetical protein
LTLVCQGHYHGSEHSGPHLTFMGGPGHNQTMQGAASASAGTGQSASTGMSAMDMSGMDMSGMDTPAMAISAAEQLAILINAPADTSTAPGTPGGSPGANIASAVTTPPLESESIATLSFLLLIFLLRHSPELYPLEMRATAAKRSQTTVMPEAPPPRLGLVCA